VRAVVARVDNDGVVGDTHVVQRLEDAADSIVVLEHAVDVLRVAMLVAAPV
jgi:excinuclease UvrABC ATPase subunit